MQHSWRADMARTAQGIETCARPGCTAERRPSTVRGGSFVYRPHAGAEWDVLIMPRCTGASMRKPRARDRFKSSE